MRIKHKKSLEELIQENKEQLLKDKQAIEKIEKRIEERHELKRLA
ncbi:MULTISPECIES: FbpB family small basic protein [Bacillaceae]|nr:MULTISPECIES: FbpB family small basic protein [Bacillus]